MLVDAIRTQLRSPKSNNTTLWYEIGLLPYNAFLITVGHGDLKLGMKMDLVSWFMWSSILIQYCCLFTQHS